MGLFGTAHGWGGEQKVPTLKPVTHHTMMKFGTVLPYHKKLYIYIYESRDTPLAFCWYQHFFTGNQLILLYEEIQLKTFFEFLKTVLTSMVTILMMSAKMPTLGLLKTKVFWNKSNDVIIFVHMKLLT